MIGIDESPITNSQIASEPTGLVDLGSLANGKLMMVGTNLFLLLTPGASSEAPPVPDNDTVSVQRSKRVNRTTTMGWSTTATQADLPFETPLKQVPTKDSPEKLLIEQQNAAIEKATEDDLARKSQDTTANMLENIAFHMWQIAMQSG